MPFEPIAIVGQSCILPGALDPAELWEAVQQGRDLVSSVPDGYWRLSKETVLASADSQAQDGTWTDRGGYVRGFEDRFEAGGFTIPPEEIEALDPLFQWVLHGTREALQSAGMVTPHPADGCPIGLVLGNLSYPTFGLVQYAESVWSAAQTDDIRTVLQETLAIDTIDPRNRYSSGLPAHLAAAALGLRGEAFSIDAACASSLYAVKLACDRLQDGRYDVMVAGAVNRADDLFIHIGFCALQAMSRRGESRPFDVSADGLLPAEGAAFVVLKRLRDAVADDDNILGVIRGIGLSNDGNSGGFLSPSVQGQIRAMDAAYEMAGLSPTDISLLECHATGTPVGDAVEIESAAQIFRDFAELPIGSLKSNMGHLTTVAGLAGLLKVLGGLQFGVRPPSRPVESPIPILADSPFRILQEAEPWPIVDGMPRRAAISAFGFGGNNAHLIVEEWNPGAATSSSLLGDDTLTSDNRKLSETPDAQKSRIAIVDLEVTVGNLKNSDEYVQALIGGGGSSALDTIEVDLAGLRFPPNDLKQALPQQLLIFEVARRLAARHESLPLDSTAVLIGMGCDPEIARYSARWRLDEWAKTLDAQGRQVPAKWIRNAKAALVPMLEAAGVVGTMPNILANRINTQLNCLGPSYTIASEELSGIRALECALDALRTGAVDAALVGAVDLSNEMVQRSAVAQLDDRQRLPAGDAAVVLMLKRVEDAQRDGDSVLAIVDTGSTNVGHNTEASRDEKTYEPALIEFGLDGSSQSLTASYGHAHAASGLLHVATAALCLRERIRLGSDAADRIQPGAPWLSASQRFARVHIKALGEQSGQVYLEQGVAEPVSQRKGFVCLSVFSGETATDVLRALDQNKQSNTGPARLVIVAHGAQELADQIAIARDQLSRLVSAGASESFGPRLLQTGIYWSSGPIDGELGFVFSAAGAAYQGMGRELLLALPSLADRTVEKFPCLAQAQHWLETSDRPSAADPFQVLQGCSLLSQAHATLTQEWLGLRPDAVMGVSSGETNAMFATGAWHDMDAMFVEIGESGMYSREIAGEYRVLQRAWPELEDDQIDWNGWRILAPAAEVEAVCRDEEYVSLTMINAPEDCLVAGLAEACQRVVDRIGPHLCVRNNREIVAHHPALKNWQREWHDIHSRDTVQVDEIRFYSNALGGSYAPTRDAIADALTDQAISSVDFRRVVNAAWEDGVRIFVEHGPRGTCSGWIRSILGEREHLVVALDRPQNGFDQALDAVAQLVAAGVAVDPDVLIEGLSTEEEDLLSTKGGARKVLSFPAHYPPVTFPPLTYARGAKPLVQPNEAIADSVRQTERVPNRADSSPMAGAQLMQPAPHLPPAPPTVAQDLSFVRGALDARMHGLASDAQYMQPPPQLTPVVAPALPRMAATTQREEAPTEVEAYESRNLDTAPNRPDRDSPPASETKAPPSTVQPDPVQRHMVDQLAEFHTQVSAAHQLFLSQQARAMERLSALRNTAQAITDRRDVATPPASASPPPEIDRPEPGATVPEDEPTPIPVDQKLTPPAAGDTEGTKSPPSSPVPALPDWEIPRSTVLGAESLPGPKLDRKQLELVASGNISEVLGPIFERQDSFERQVRMPMPPLLLADRVLGIDAEPGAVGQKGIIWTETDIREDSWYLHHGHIPTGIMIESGQADLLLVSYLGADFVNKGDRVYRLLGCEVTFHRGLASVGDTLRYEIHIDGYAQQGPIRLFFFHYDCTIGGELAFSVRHGQAGFFTDEELANSGGVLWDPMTAEVTEDARVDPPALPCSATSFSAEQVIAFSEGRVSDCFGEAYAAADQHVRTPTISSGRMLLFDEVTTFDPDGGPWGRGYLRAEDHLASDEWFFAGHFKNDPCMPGTLMLEGCLQAMSFYLAGMGYTLDRDGWRFESLPQETYKLICRGQAIPGNKQVTYEVFVDEVIDGPIPTLYADLLVTVDGLRAFYVRRWGLRLIPAYPLESRQALLSGPEFADDDPGRNARTPTHVYDPNSIAACAWGRPSDAFGPTFERFDGPQRCPRLPGPPYLFMTRITSVDAPEGEPVTGGTLEAEYQIPSDAWYFAENGNRTMPFPVLLEAALQPCGWFASYKGSVLASQTELFFRNLDGTATQYRECFPEDGVLTTHVRSTSVSRMGSMTIMGFEVECTISGKPVLEMKTSFGFFPEEALANQAGLPITDADKDALLEPANYRLELGARPPRYCSGALRLPGPMLLLLDRISGYWAEGGQHGLGRVRSEIDVDGQDWFFKSHFMGDSVQPGSLGLEAMLQTLQFFMIESGMGSEIENPRFEPIQLGQEVDWKFRGQVLPSATLVTVELEITELGDQTHADWQGHDPGVYAVASASLWVDGMRIYEASGIGMRIVSDGPEQRAIGDVVLDPERDAWLRDHCPTWTVPALAMMSMVDRLAEGARLRMPGLKIAGLRNVRVHRWLGFANGAQRVLAVGTPKGSGSVAMQLLVWDQDRGRYSPVASGDVLLAEDWQLGSPPWENLQDADVLPDPYASGLLFHGPAYQLLSELNMGNQGSSSWLDLDANGVPIGALNQGLMDAATHGIPHDEMWRWCEEIPRDVAAYPIAITEGRFYGPAPTTGMVRCETRFRGFQDDDQRFPMVQVQLIASDKVWAEFEVVEALFPKGPIGQAEPEQRRAFLRDRVFVPGLALSRYEQGRTSLSESDVRASDWLAGTVAAAYAVDSGGGGDDLGHVTREIAIKEHVSRKLEVHPADLQVSEDRTKRRSDAGHSQRPTAQSTVVTSRLRPFVSYRVDTWQVGNTWHAVDADSSQEQGGLDLLAVQEYWRDQFGSGDTLIEDLMLALMQRFVRRVEITDPEAFYSLRGQGVLYLANHQMDLESVLFVLLLPALQGTITTAVARQELTDSWMNKLLDVFFRHPDMTDPDVLLLIDRSNPQAVYESLRNALDTVRTQQKSLLVHVEGTRSIQARQPVQMVSSALIDLAVSNEVPIVPVRFFGGVPVQPLAEPLEFPIDYGQQDIWIGAPLLPESLAVQSSAERKASVLSAINGFNGRWRTEQPIRVMDDFKESVAKWRRTHPVTGIQAALYCALSSAEHASAETQRLLSALSGDVRGVGAIDGDDAVSSWLRGCSQDLFGIPIVPKK